MEESESSITITCRSKAPHFIDIEKSAQTAVEINHLNRPSAARLLKKLGRLPSSEELAVATNKFWGIQGANLTVSFLDSPSQSLRKRILSHMNAWNLKANVNFVETQDLDNAIVRINRDTLNDPEWDGYWCFLGTDMLIYNGPNNQTMNLQGFTENSSEHEFRSIVRHEAGHALGFEHELQRQDMISRIDRDKAIKYYKDNYNWTPADVDAQILNPLNIEEWEGTQSPDESSIMTYHTPAEITVDNKAILGGNDISPLDHEYAALIYPKPL